ncbi:hypothetical protein HSR122_0526 [Halapricum desulfuricans]|uniref:Uncharacterized protein n=1 Tax=Halapricum desulfuricans TaxID=2841257 RepID=A0A897N9Y4_9EURY|nr:hypothetical protein HSR122_0526 [Halapricum desulfuricans]
MLHVAAVVGDANSPLRSLRQAMLDEKTRCDNDAILIQRENPALPAKDERSDAQSEPRTEQGGSESRKLW